MAAATDTPPATTAAPSPEQLAAWLQMLLRNEQMPDEWFAADLSGLTPPPEWVEAMKSDQSLWTPHDISRATLREVQTVYGWRTQFLATGVVSKTATPPTVFDDVDKIRADAQADGPKERRPKTPAVWLAWVIREWEEQMGLVDEFWRPIPERPGRPINASIERRARAKAANA